MIIPALLTLNKRIAKERIEWAKQMSGWIHLDFLDHTLYLFESLQAQDYAGIDWGDLHLEAHAMTQQPLTLLESSLPIERVIVHYELNGWENVYTSCIDSNRDCWVAIGPETKVNELNLPADLLGAVIMGVEPGQTGQAMIANTYERLESFKDRFPDISVSVDGGVSADTLRLLVAHGADHLVIGSAIWHQTNPVRAYEHYVQLAQPFGGMDDQ